MAELAFGMFRLFTRFSKVVEPKAELGDSTIFKEGGSKLKLTGSIVKSKWLSLTDLPWVSASSSGSDIKNFLLVGTGSSGSWALKLIAVISRKLSSFPWTKRMTLKDPSVEASKT